MILRWQYLRGCVYGVVEEKCYQVQSQNDVYGICGVLRSSTQCGWRPVLRGDVPSRSVLYWQQYVCVACTDRVHSVGEDQCYELLCRVGVCCTDNSMYVWHVQIEYTVWVKTSATRCCAESECVVLTTVCMCGMYRSSTQCGWRPVLRGAVPSRSVLYWQQYVCVACTDRVHSVGEDQCYEVLCRVGVCCTDNSMYVWHVQIEYTVWVKTSATRCCAESECVVLTTVCMCGMYRSSTQCGWRPVLRGAVPSRSVLYWQQQYVWHVQIEYTVWVKTSATRCCAESECVVLTTVCMCGMYRSSTQCGWRPVLRGAVPSRSVLYWQQQYVWHVQIEYTVWVKTSATRCCAESECVVLTTVCMCGMYRSSTQCGWRPVLRGAVPSRSVLYWQQYVCVACTDRVHSVGEDQCYEVLCRVGVCCTDNSMYVWHVQIEYTVWVKTSATSCCAESECVVLTTVCMCGMYRSSTQCGWRPVLRGAVPSRSVLYWQQQYVWHVQIEYTVWVKTSATRCCAESECVVLTTVCMCGMYRSSTQCGWRPVLRGAVPSRSVLYWQQYVCVACTDRVHSVGEDQCYEVLCRVGVCCTDNSMYVWHVQIEYTVWVKTSARRCCAESECVVLTTVCMCGMYRSSTQCGWRPVLRGAVPSRSVLYWQQYVCVACTDRVHSVGEDQCYEVLCWVGVCCTDNNSMCGMYRSGPVCVKASATKCIRVHVCVLYW